MDKKYTKNMETKDIRLQNLLQLAKGRVKTIGDSSRDTPILAPPAAMART